MTAVSGVSKQHARHQVRVLLVGGDQAQHLLVCELLPQSEGFAVDWGPECGDAVAKARACPYAAALVDDQLEAEDSRALIADLRASGVPAVMLTTDGPRESVRRALEAGAADCLGKTEISASMLQHAVRHAIEQGALRGSEAMYRSTFDEAPVGVALLDRAGRWIRVNRYVERMLGCTADALVQTPVDNLGHPDDPPHSLDPALLGGGATRAVSERRLRRHDGTFVWTHITTSPLASCPDVCEGHIAILQDISTRKHAEEELGVTFDLSPDMLCTANVQGYFTRVNPAFTAVLGYDTAVLLSEPFIDLVHPDDRPNTLRQMQDLADGLATRSFTNRYRASSGEYKWVEWHARQDRATGVIHAVARDLTERRQLEQQLRQMQKIDAIGQLAGGVAHDFNNILTSIMGFAELALSALKEDQPAFAEVSEILLSAERAAALTRQLLAFSRMQLLRPETLDVNSVVSHMAGMLQRIVGEQVQLNRIFADQLWTVDADRSQLEQVVLNLVVNARDAMPHGGVVTLETRNVDVDAAYCETHPAITPGAYVLLAVSDHGTGMSDAIRARLFEPFFTTKAQGRGTGLGLATIYGIVKQSNGFIWVYSEVGHGTTFKVYLPRSFRPAQAPIAPVRTHTIGGTETVLVVDDQPDIRNVIVQVLQRHGYTVLVAADSESAQHVLRTHEGPLDLLLTDVVLPGQSGTALAAAAVTIRPGLPVVYMSGYTQDAAVRTGIMQVGLALLEKPFTSASLLRHVREAIDRARA